MKLSSDFLWPEPEIQKRDVAIIPGMKYSITVKVVSINNSFKKFNWDYISQNLTLYIYS